MSYVAKEVLSFLGRRERPEQKPATDLTGGYGRGRRSIGPSLNTNGIVDISSPTLIRWQQFEPNVQFPDDSIRVTFEGGAAKLIEAFAVASVGPFTYHAVKGRYLVHNVSNSAAWNGGLVPLSGTFYEGIDPILALGMVHHFPHWTALTAGSGGMPLFGKLAWPPAGLRSRNYLFRLSAVIESNNGLGNLNYAFGNASATATFGHTLAPGDTHILVPGQVGGVDATGFSFGGAFPILSSATQAMH